MNLNEFIDVMKRSSPYIRKMFKDYANHPTASNQSYAIGYLAGVYEHHVGITKTTYHYLLVLAGQIKDNESVREIVRKELA